MRSANRSTTARAIVVMAIAMGAFASAATAFGQTGAPAGRFVLGPLQWTPTLQLRDAGVDSNVFNTPDNAKQDVSATFTPRVDSTLALGILQAATQASAEYIYFERYTNERALNGRVASRMAFPLSRIRPTATVSWARIKDQASNELDVRVPHTDRGYGAGVTTKLTSRLDVTLELNRQSIAYDLGKTFRGVDVAAQLNRKGTTAVLGIQAAISPLTVFIVDGGAGRDEFELDSSRDTDNVRGSVGLVFAPDAIISGHASIGYHTMHAQHPSVLPSGGLEFSGVTSNVDLSYTLLGRTRFNPRLSRDTTYSVSATQPYYVSTAGGLEIYQALVGPLDLVVRGHREKLAYPESALEAARTDFADTYGGGLSFRVSAQGRIGLNYDDTKRRSSAGSMFSYARRHIYTSVTYGF